MFNYKWKIKILGTKGKINTIYINNVGYCPQFDAIFEHLTVYENLECFASIK